MKNEMKSLMLSDVWGSVEMPNGINGVGWKWVFKKFYDIRLGLQPKDMHRDTDKTMMRLLHI